MSVRDRVLDLVQTALRLLPWPTEPGLRRIGAPGEESPVLVTGNYDLTVRRVCRSLRGLDAWLVVVPSGGVNVWCAAAGGMLTTAQVVTALKTSGIDELVRHRRAILPQLAATGVIADDVTRRCGWSVGFGPVDAADLPRFLAAGGHADEAMRRVRFGPRERLEMACAWAAPMSLVAVPPAWWLARAWVWPLLASLWLTAALVFFVYDRLRGSGRVLLWGAVVLTTGLAVITAGGGWAGGMTGAALAAVVLAVLTFDFEGSTPIVGGRLFESRGWRIRLDGERCVGIFACWAVCPVACFERSPGARVVDLAHADRCITCGACVVQCPEDALCFEAADGRRIAPAAIRRYKLNLLGRRGVDAGVTTDADA